MYDDHYGLTGRPFQLTPDPRFWFDSAMHRRAMAYLGYGLSQGEGFIVVTGDIGAGKTTLVGHLTGTIDRAALNVITIVSSQIAADDLLRTVCAGLDVDAAGLSKAAMLRAIEKGLHAVARGGRRTLLIVDEVQALPDDSLEELRMLSNFQAAGHALLQIVLLGQPEFRERLAQPALDQLRQRVIALHHLGPMDAAEVEPYLAHRLSIVGWTGRPDFSEGAVAAIHDWSQGIPRRINQLTSRVMLHGAVEGIEAFDADDVAAVIADMADDAAPPAAPSAPPSPIVEHEPGLRVVRPFLVDDDAAGIRPRPILAEAAPPPPSVHIVPDEPLAAIESATAAEAQADDDVLDLTDPVHPAAPSAPVAPSADDRLTAIERQLEEQDAALRRVLALLVDWVEAGAAAAPPDIRAAAG